MQLLYSCIVGLNNYNRMSKFEKLLERIQQKPKDFTWDELQTLLVALGYEPVKPKKTGGSRRKFVDGKQHVISLHKPHPSNVLKEYVIKDILEMLKEKGHIQ